MITWFSCRFNCFLCSYKVILYFDSCSFTRVDSVLITAFDFIMRLWACYNKSAIFKASLRDFVPQIICLTCKWEQGIRVKY